MDLIIQILDKVKAFLESLPAKERAKILATITMMQTGTTGIVVTRQINGSIRELKVKQHRILYWSRPECLARCAARMNGRNQICAAEAASLSSKTPWYPSANAPSALRRGWRDGLFYFQREKTIYFIGGFTKKSQKTPLREIENAKHIQKLISSK